MLQMEQHQIHCRREGGVGGRGQKGKGSKNISLGGEVKGTTYLVLAVQPALCLKEGKGS